MGNNASIKAQTNFLSLIYTFKYILYTFKYILKKLILWEKVLERFRGEMDACGAGGRFTFPASRFSVLGFRFPAYCSLFTVHGF